MLVLVPSSHHRDSAFASLPENEGISLCIQGCISARQKTSLACSVQPLKTGVAAPAQPSFPPLYQVFVPKEDSIICVLLEIDVAIRPR
jgi:hypothetical protein